MRHRHTDSEIAAKLHMAGELATQGKLHSDIAKSLGISIMTYHRWRKAHGPLVPTTQRLAHAERTDIQIEREEMSRIGDLQLENSRLRRLVTDLLLEKVKLEERLGASDLMQNSRGVTDCPRRPDINYTPQAEQAPH
jgi:putative transposase